MDYKTISEISREIKYGKMPDKKRIKNTGKYPIYSGYRIVGFYDEYNINKNQLVIVARGVGGTGDVKLTPDKCFLTNLSIGIILNEEIVNIKYIYYYFKINNLRYLDSGSAQSQITINDLKNVKVPVPSIKIQNKVVSILDNLDKKILVNNQTNDNLSEQLKQIFNNKFYDKIQNNDCSEFKEYILYDVLDVIDNRGKTPKLVEVSNYPIIDVRAISGENRIIDYKQCQKYVDDEVYNTFFRSGHPKINDILISTVGSLAEMKIYMENKGTIAQNVVALRSKYDYPMYIYQYLKAIKNDLISYNIGSVQPSIKVTQFMKHNIYIPKDKELYEFENIAKLYTDKMFNISKENETLEQLRDTLLPKLMNGEIDLDKIEI